MPLRHILAVLLVALPCAAWAQADNGPSRPSFLQAMGLLDVQNVDIARDGAPFASLSLPQGEGVRAVARDLGDAAGEVIAAWDFVTEDGRFIESITLTTAMLERGEPETRRFALANMLVLRSFPQLLNQFPEARLLAFGPMPNVNELDMVQMIGTFETPEDRRAIVFRHIGVLRSDSDEVLIAIVNVDTTRLPIRATEDLNDTFAGVALNTLKLADAPPDASAAEDAPAAPAE
ncbi:MAG: hypothetical protein AAF646_04595 [Pseudomonadota bacterium]